MSVKCLKIAWETKTQSPIQKLVLVRLADRANENTDACWPGIASLAKECCISESSVHRAIKGLLDLGSIRVETGGGNKSNTYFFTGVPQTPVSNGHPCQKDTGGVSNGQGRGVTQTPELKLNSNLTQRGGPQKKWIRELEFQIKDISDEIQRLTDFGRTEADKAERLSLINRRKQLRKELHYA